MGVLPGSPNPGSIPELEVSGAWLPVTAGEFSTLHTALDAQYDNNGYPSN